MRPAERAWCALAAGVVGYNLAAKDDELMSNAADRWMLTHPWLTRSIAAAVTCHICNLIPSRWDLVHWLFVGARGLYPLRRAAASVIAPPE